MDELRVAPGTTAQEPLSLVWVGDAFVLLWESSGTFYLTRISPAGAVESGPDAILTPPSGSAQEPRLIWNGQQLALSWIMDDYDPLGGGLTSNLGLARFTPQGQMLGSLIPLAAPEQGFLDTGALVWDGAHYTVFPVRSPGEVARTRVICDCVDGDDDGFIGCHECDDADGTVYPGGPQVCDGLNNDCLHASWPGLEGTNEFDNDGDGPSVCSGDCDDTSSFTYPGAAPLDDPIACIRDQDGDDYGAMSPPDGVTPGSDCNDTEAPLRTPPGEVPWLQVRSLDPVATEITWQPVTDWGGGPEGTYWLLRSTDPADFVSNSVSACAVHVFEGTTATHLVTLQPVNSVYAYLVLAANHCVEPLSNGPVGDRSDGTPRPARVCP
jgi:hypothetical protein